MCGIFGAIKLNRNITISSIKGMARTQEKRGRHAFGFSWISEDGRIHAYRSPGRISEALFLLDRMQGAKAIIGHTRHATHGDPKDNVTNHPHPCDGGWFVHNGQIPNHEELIDEHNLLPATDCDSEVLGLLIQSLPGALLRRVQRAINMADLSVPLNLAGLWTRPGRLVIARRGNPLSISTGKSGNLYFASLPAGMPGHPNTVQDSTATMLSLADGSVSELPLTPTTWDGKKKIAGSGLFGSQEVWGPKKKPLIPPINITPSRPRYGTRLCFVDDEDTMEPTEGAYFEAEFELEDLEEYGFHEVEEPTDGQAEED